MLTQEIDDVMTQFLKAFNANDLDQVMAFFREDAVYEPGDGRTHKGKEEIRAAFTPQFQGELGAMRFDEFDRIIDAEHCKAAYRWVCRHDLSGIKTNRLSTALRKFVAGIALGRQFHWQGIDVFHLDASGKIAGKFTYAWYGSRPFVQRTLG